MSNAWTEPDTDDQDHIHFYDPDPLDPKHNTMAETIRVRCGDRPGFFHGVLPEGRGVGSRFLIKVFEDRYADLQIHSVDPTNRTFSVFMNPCIPSPPPSPSN